MTPGSFAHKNARFLRGYGRIFIPIWLAVAGLGAIVAAADSFLEFGLGYDWNDAKTGLILFGCGIPFWFVWQGALTLYERFNEIMFGPDPNKKDD